jgi:hypothetical protein
MAVSIERSRKAREYFGEKGVGAVEMREGSVGRGVREAAQ